MALLGTGLLCRPAAATPDVGITTETLGTRFTTAVSSGFYPHAVTSSGSNRALVVSVGITNSTVSISSVVWDPDTTVSGDEQTMSCPGTSAVTIGSGRKLAICTLLAPTISSGNGRVTVTFSGGTDSFTSSATTFTGISGFRTATASPGSKTFGSWTPACSTVSGGYLCALAVATQIDDVVFDLAGQGESDPPGGSRTFTAGAGQAKHEDVATLSSGNHLRVATSVAIASGTTTTMQWTYGMATSGNSVGQVGLPMIASSAVTAATVGERTAVRFGAVGTRIAWQTQEEASHLGFQVWRQTGGERIRVTTGLLPGSVLATGAAPLVAGRSYLAWDDAGKPGDRYWLEEIAARGPSRWHGPIVPTVAAASAGVALRRLATAPPPAFASSRPRPDLLVKAARALVAHQDLFAAPENLACLNPSAAAASVKIAVSHDGWYRVEASALRAAGLRPDVDPARLALFADGREVAFRVVASTALDAIEFYGRGDDTRETSTRIYWLAASNGAHLRVHTAPPGTRGDLTPSYLAEVTLRERSVYFAALLNGPKDNFFGAVISSGPVTQILATPDPVAGATAILQVALQGGTAGAHKIGIGINKVDLAVLAWSGQTSMSRDVPIPPGLITAGANEIVLTPDPSTSALALVDHLSLRYPRQYRAVNDELEAIAPAGATVRVGGFSSPDVVVYDVTDPGAPILLPVVVDSDGAMFGATVSLGAGAADRTLRALAGPGRRVPDSVTANLPSSICMSAGAELAIVAPRTFFGALAPFVAARTKAGWTVELDDVEDVFDEMTYGAHRADAINRFVQQRRAGIASRTRYLLLVGNASLDPQNFLGKGVPDLVPTRLIDTDVIETASDDALADLDGDGLPELAVGRWPARTVDEVTALVSATLAMDTTTPFDRGALIVTGPSGGLDFRASASEVAAALLQPPDLFDADGLSGDVAHSGLVSHWAESPSFVQYFGHGSQGIWQGLLAMDQLSDIGHGGKRAVVVAMTCLNGFFQDVYQGCLAERLLQAESGAVAVWASSDLYDAGAQAALAASFVENARTMALGDAVRLARIHTGGAGRAMVLFGDPTLFGTPLVTAPGATVTSDRRPAISSIMSPSPTSGAVPDPAGCAVAAGHPTGAGSATALGLLIAIAGRRRRSVPR